MIVFSVEIGVSLGVNRTIPVLIHTQFEDAVVRYFNRFIYFGDQDVPFDRRT